MGYSMISTSSQEGGYIPKKFLSGYYAGNANRGWWGILKYPLKILGKLFEKRKNSEI